MSSPRLLIGRESQPGAFYLVTTVLHDRATLFLDPALARLAADELHAGLADGFAWVIMPDHVHWLFQLRTIPLARCVQAFKARSPHAINAARGIAGPVWQAGYHDHRLRDDEDLRVRARYVVENPLRRGLAARIEDYPHWWCPWVSGSNDLS